MPGAAGKLDCPKAKRDPGTPFAVSAPLRFPGAKLKLSHGKYGFSVTWTRVDIHPIDSTAPAFNLHLTLKGTVVSATNITGTLKAEGGFCATRKPLKFTAKLNNSDTVAPNQ